MDDSSTAQHWFARHLVRVRQLIDHLQHRLVFIPVVYVFAAVGLSQLTLLIDRGLGNQTVPDWLATTVPSARAVFAAIAGGLITSITLLLSMMLVTVQLASSQFSPRTLRDWLGNRTLQHTVGIVLGTAVFCLLALRSTKDLGLNGPTIVPHLTVLVGVALGVVSLVAVVRAVDQITHSLQVGSVASRLAGDTIEVARSVAVADEVRRYDIAPESGALAGDGDLTVPEHATPIEARRAGWVQQIDGDALLRSLPPGSTAYVTVELGEFVPHGAPVMWIAPAPPDDHPCREAVTETIALGDTRTMQQDVEFGIVQLTDIAVRALSPGVNDPMTATDIIVHLGDVLISVWERPELRQTLRLDDRTLVRQRPDHGRLLERAVGPVRRYGSADPEVMIALVRMLSLLESESRRRGLPGPTEPVERAMHEVRDAADRSAWTAAESDALDSAG